MSLNTPVYVAGLERGVLPIGDWSTFTTLSRFSIPSMLAYGIGSLSERKKCWLNIGCSVSFIRVDFPLPLTPVTTMSLPSGNSTSTFFRLLPDAP